MIRIKCIETILMIVPLWLACAATAQVAPEAADLLQSALEAHGGEALHELATYREAGQVTVFGPAGEPVAQLTGVSLVDLASGVYRDELYAGDMAITISQITPDGAWTWTADTGVLRAPPTQVEQLRSAFYRGLFGLRFGADRDAAALLGQQTWRDVEGTAVRVTTRGVDTTYLLSDDSRMLAQRYDSPQLGAVTVVYSDYREHNGLPIPYRAEYYAQDRPILRSDLDEAEPSAELPAGAFDRPEDGPR